MLGIEPEIHLLARAQAVARMGDDLPFERAPAHPAIDMVAEEDCLRNLPFEPPSPPRSRAARTFSGRTDTTASAPVPMPSPSRQGRVKR